MSRKLIILSALAFVLLQVCAFAAEPFTFIHISDSHITASGHFAENLKAIANEVNAMKPRPAFVVSTGDLTELGFSEEFAKYKETISGFAMPVYSVPGNHETKWSNWGKLGPKRFLGQDPYYSFDHGGIHFVGLDSSMWLEHHGFIDQSQLTWLKKDLDKAGRETPVVLYYHHCPGFLANELQLLRVLRPYNVRLILVGHGHNFHTWKRNGILFQEVKGAMNDKGGYRVLEVSGSEIRSYTALTGGAKTPDGAISLKPAANPVVLVKPIPDSKIEGQVHVRAIIMGPMQKVEYRIAGDYQPITPDSSGVCDVKVDWTGAPGWHTVSIRATDADGMEWYDFAQVRINAGSREVWRMKATGAVQRPIRASGDRLYFGTWGGDVYCLDARTGRQVWRRNVGSDVISEVAVGSGLAYLGATDGRVLALNADTGEVRWQFETGGPIQASPVVGGGRVFLGSGDLSFYALDAKTGRLCRKFPMTRFTQELPIYMDGVVYFGSWDGNLYALNARDESVRWKYKTGDSLYASPSNSNPATDGRRIAFGMNPWKKGDGDVVCLDVKTGGLTWKRNTSGKSVCSFNSPFITGGRLFIADLNGYVSCLSMTDGKDIWVTPTGQTAYDDSPVVADGKVYIGGLVGGVFCLDAATGKNEWTYSAGDGYLFASPTVWNDLLIIPSTDGTVTAVRNGPAIRVQQEKPN